jgi:hypothetical protein
MNVGPIGTISNNAAQTTLLYETLRYIQYSPPRNAIDTQKLSASTDLDLAERAALHRRWR